MGDFERPLWPFLARVAGVAIKDAARQLTAPQSAADGRLDPSVYGKAQAAFDSVFSAWQARLDAARRDLSLSPDQRAAAVFALRLRQQSEAAGARKRVIDDEKSRVRAISSRGKGKRGDGHHPS